MHIYETDFYHIEIITDNANQTKYEQIQKTKDIEASDVEYIALIKNKTDDSVLI